MTGGEHTDYIHSKLCKVIGILNRYKYVLPAIAKEVFYKYLFYPYS